MRGQFCSDTSRGAWWWLALAVWTLASAGCESCSSAPPLATLRAIDGEGVTRDFAASQESWEHAEMGATFQLEDGLRTGDASTADLALFNGSVLSVRPATQIRFRTASEAGLQRIEVKTGEAVLRTGSEAMGLETHMGMAILKSGTQVRLSAVGDAVRYAVELGSATFRDGQGQAVEVSAGQEYEVGIGEAVFTMARPEAVAEPPEPEVEETEEVEEVEEVEEPLPADDEGGADRALGQPSLEVSGVQLGAGDSLTVHTPVTPVAVGISTAGTCTGTAVVRILGTPQRFHGEGFVAIDMAAGSRAYGVHCVNEAGVVENRPRARGRLTILRDSGNRRLPARAPSTRVEADGRTYNVLYQNQLPNVTVSWPMAPKADSYTVEVDGKTRTSDAPELRLKSGELGDGTHKVSFAALDRKSRYANVNITFDNAAPKAAISKPDNASFAPGDTVDVAGVALPGWNVTADHGTIDLDSSQRFTGQVTTSASNPDVVLRLTHPRRGVHVYVRRSQRSP